MVPDDKIVFDVFLGLKKDTPAHLADRVATYATVYSDYHHTKFTPGGDLLIVEADKK
jgi:hypothetical protein